MKEEEAESHFDFVLAVDESTVVRSGISITPGENAGLPGSLDRDI